jgi:hypothetical protein
MRCSASVAMCCRSPKTLNNHGDGDSLLHAGVRQLSYITFDRSGHRVAHGQIDACLLRESAVIEASLSITLPPRRDVRSASGYRSALLAHASLQTRSRKAMAPSRGI